MRECPDVTTWPDVVGAAVMAATVLTMLYGVYRLITRMMDDDHI